MDTLIILCLLGDPTLPAASIKHTGGFQVDIQELLENIYNKNCNIHVITNTSKYRKKKYEEFENYKIHRINFDDCWLSNQELLMENYDLIKLEIFQILKQILTEKNLIHSFYWLSGILAYEAYKKYHTRYVHSVVSLAIGKTLGGSETYYSGQFEWEKKFLKEAEILFSITEAEREQLIKYYNVNESNIIVVGRNVHPVFEFPYRLPSGYPVNIEQEQYVTKPIELMNYKWWMLGAFTYVGRIQEIKGLQYIIAAWIELFKKYKESTPPLWICGGTPESIQSFRQGLKQFLNYNKLEDAEKEQKLVWWGYLDFAGICTLFLKTKVLVTHSQYEPGGRVLLEAMAASIPVIATPNGFAKDLIKNGENGFTVNFGDTEDLINKMELFIHHPEKTTYLGKNANITFLEQKNQWKCYEKQFQVYKKFGLDSFD